MDNPYLRRLLYKLFLEHIPAWSSVAAGFKPYTDRTTRVPFYYETDPDIEKVETIFREMSDPLRWVIEAKYKHKLPLYEAAKKCGYSTRAYRQFLKVAEFRIEQRWNDGSA